MQYCIAFGMLLLLTSCYSTKYLATYAVQSKTTNTIEVSTKFIDKLADKNELTKDNKFIGTDTLGFYGKPYHYFTFSFEQKDSQTIIKLDYWGTYGSRRNPPYRDLLQNITDSIQANFTLLDKDIKEQNNAKKKNKMRTTDMSNERNTGYNTRLAPLPLTF
jgi:hypothetical protein